jgi:hypothetical protein
MLLVLNGWKFRRRDRTRRRSTGRRKAKRWKRDGNPAQRSSVFYEGYPSLALSSVFKRLCAGVSYSTSICTPFFPLPFLHSTVWSEDKPSITDRLRFSVLLRSLHFFRPTCSSFLRSPSPVTSSTLPQPKPYLVALHLQPHTTSCCSLTPWWKKWAQRPPAAAHDAVRPRRRTARFATLLPTTPPPEQSSRAMCPRLATIRPFLRSVSLPRLLC